ncbi:MAG: ATP-binding cassette domain-containing protein, partial [Bacteroidota bacterium]
MISIQNITKTYTGLTIYNNFSLDISPNEITCILGPSGCGKTTLLNLVGGIIEPDEGTIRLSEYENISYIL